MSQFRVWSPLAKSVELVLRDDIKLPMRLDEGGWWSADCGGDDSEIDYAFSVDGEAPLPDPRSLWQPQGVHGFSRTLDHASFAWQHDSWSITPLSSAVIYELHIGTFTAEGSFVAAIDKLDYLTGLGVTHVEIMPVAEFPGSHGWGYDGVGLYAAHHAYGGPKTLKRLVDACHARGLNVLLDVVYNHLGPDGNYLPRFGPYFTNRYATPWGQAVNIDDAHSDEVRSFFIENALMWLRDYRFDGLRLDAVDKISDRSAVHFLEEMQARVGALSRELDRELVLIAESDLNDPRLAWPIERGGYGLPAFWNDDFHHALHSVLTWETGGYYMDFGSLAHLARAFSNGYVHDGAYSKFRRRRHGRPATDLDTANFVVSSQNHDQVGNRAQGDRLVHVAGLRRAQIAAALVLTSPFVPLLFQGEEWAASSPFQYFTDHDNADLGEAVSQGRRKEFAEFGWLPENLPDPQSQETFLRSKLQWQEQRDEPHATMLAWYRQLLVFRRSHPELGGGALDSSQVEFDQEKGWFSYRRGNVQVWVNIGQAEMIVPVPGGGRLIASEPSVHLVDKNLRLPPESVAILEPTANLRGAIRS